jgi:hypothetical protein
MSGWKDYEKSLAYVTGRIEKGDQLEVRMDGDTAVLSWVDAKNKGAAQAPQSVQIAASRAGSAAAIRMVERESERVSLQGNANYATLLELLARDMRREFGLT